VEKMLRCFVKLVRRYAIGVQKSAKNIHTWTIASAARMNAAAVLKNAET
jgi:hypothetical protein